MIITDQDGGICNTIARVFRGTKYRYCSWHIGKNAVQHLRELRCNDEFKEDYDAWIYGIQQKEEFENRWLQLKEKYSIQDGHWLAKIYEKRHHSASLYLKDTFFNGMTSSQRS